MYYQHRLQFCFPVCICDRLRRFCETVAQPVGQSTPKSTVESTIVDEPTNEDVSSTIFDPSSNVVQQTLANHGWIIGSIVAPKKIDPCKPRADEQFEIGIINDDGTIGLHPIDADGELIKETVVMTDQVKLQQTYRSVDKSNRLSKWSTLDDTHPICYSEYWSSVASLALICADHEHFHCPPGTVYVQKSPVVKVVVSKVPEQDIVLVPYPAVIKDFRHPTALKVTVQKEPAYPLFHLDKPDISKSTDMHVFWRMRRVTDKKHANMELTTVEVTCPVLKLTKKSPKTVQVTVTVATVISKVEPGDELVLFVPAKEKAKEADKKLLPVASEPRQKKQKVE